ncbi:hypothetical protein OH767_49765 [Streptomyces sp. NBC_01614]
MPWLSTAMGSRNVKSTPSALVAKLMVPVGTAVPPFFSVTWAVTVNFWPATAGLRDGSSTTCVSARPTLNSIWRVPAPGRGSDPPRESVTMNVVEKSVPTAVGVPETTPVDPFSSSPAASEVPSTRRHV